MLIPAEEKLTLVSVPTIGTDLAKYLKSYLSGRIDEDDLWRMVILIHGTIKPGFTHLYGTRTLSQWCEAFAPAQPIFNLTRAQIPEITARALRLNIPASMGGAIGYFLTAGIGEYEIVEMRREQDQEQQGVALSYIHVGNLFDHVRGSCAPQRCVRLIYDAVLLSAMSTEIDIMREVAARLQGFGREFERLYREKGYAWISQR